MPKTLVVLLFTVMLDGIGIGMILPVMPDLFRQFGGSNATPVLYGSFLAIYALMQFVCAPILGVLSDRFGRRRVLAASLFGGIVDYVAMAFAPNLAVLFVARAIAGITGANMAVVSASIADITPPDKRAQRFGYVSATFGLGFVFGPALGGMLGELSVRLPMLLAALLNALNLIMVLALLPGSRQPSKPLSWHSFNPLLGLASTLSLSALLPLIGVYLVVAIVGEIGATVWVIHGQERYTWSPTTVGLSLAGLGLFHAIIQGLASGPFSNWLGETKATLFAIFCDATACILLALAGQGWMAIALIPLFCLGGVGDPALLSMLSRQVRDDHQGRLQGVLSGATGLAAVAGPPLFGATYAITKDLHPGAVWLLGGALYLICAPVLLRFRQQKVDPVSPAR